MRHLSNVLAAAGCAALVSACNAMLGIAEPDDAILVAVDGGGSVDAATDSLGGVRSDGGVTAPAADGGSTGSSPPLTPFDYAWWPVPSSPAESLPSPQDYDTEREGVVRDRVTGLTWQRTTEESGLSAADAARYCAELALDGGGFRLPTRVELSSLLDVRQKSPAIDAEVFPETLPEPYWTSSPFADGPSLGWVVHFGYSTSHVRAELVDQPHPVRCVRVDDGDALVGRPTLEIADELVTDALTGLSWQRRVDAEAKTLPDAVAYCTGLDLGGQGFRLPTLREFQTIVLVARTSPAIDVEAFPDTSPTLFWTQSPVADFADWYWAVSFADGSDLYVSSPSAARVRCVRHAP